MDSICMIYDIVCLHQYLEFVQVYSNLCFSIGHELILIALFMSLFPVYILSKGSFF